MSRKHRQQAIEAAQRASEAARILQQRSQQAREGQEVDPPTEPTEPPEDQGKRPEPRNDPRRLAMEEIEERHERTRAEEMNPSEEPQEPQAELEAETPAEPETPTEPAAPEPIKTVRVKVDGEEFDVPEADVLEAGGVPIYQRERAAENRLRKANEALAETKRVQAEIAQWAQKQVQQQPAPAKPTVTQLLHDNIDTIRWGTPEESAAALQKVIELANPQLDPRAISNYAVTQIQKQNAVEKFKDEFSDVVANPLVLKLAITLENERLAELTKTGQPPADWVQFYRAIGNEARSVMGRQSQAAPATPVSSDSTSQPAVDKEARKASIVTLPTAAARAALPEAPKPETRDDVLNAMRKARGIPTG